MPQFGAASLSSDTQYLSLLYHLGMLTLAPQATELPTYRLVIPNRVIQDLQWEHLALMMRDQEGAAIDTRALESALRSMAVEGDIQPFLDLFFEGIVKKLGIKDTRRLDERALKLALMAYLSQSRMFHVLSEKEFAQGYCDLFLGASMSAPQARFSWLLELKYVPSGATPARIEAAFAEAQRQVERYASDEDLLPLLLGNRELRAGMVVFVGTRKVQFRPWPPPPPAERQKAAAKRQRAAPARKKAETKRKKAPAKARVAKKPAARGRTRRS